MHECNDRCALPSGECVHDVIRAHGGAPMSLELIGAHFNTSKQMIAFLEKQALKRLAYAMKLRGLTYDDLTYEPPQSEKSLTV